MLSTVSKCLAGVAVFCIGGILPAVASAQPAEKLPVVQREFRAAWVATVANIDWPSKPGLSTADQQAEAIKILDTAREINMNAIVFQVRPHCDAMYKSDIEPWSSYITGIQGQAPDPYYDPLEFWVKESHARGMELHCWFNPYRANHSSNRGPEGTTPEERLVDSHVVKTHPDWVKKLGTKGYYWLDPAKKEVQDLTTAVVMDVVRRYDVDGIHFDDYFYPYPDYNDGKDFPDDDTWAAYQASGGKLSRGDFRRDGVNKLMESLYAAIKKEKKHVKFGLSPFGIGKPGEPASIAGFNQYETLYADAQLWLNEGWVDYYTPQLYWKIEKIPQSYPILLGWWISQNHHNRNIWPGLYTSRYGNARDEQADAEEIPRQILVTRGMAGASGHVHFSMKALLNNRETLTDKLKTGLYAAPALIPPSPWLDDKAPATPSIKSTGAEGNSVSLALEAKDAGDVFVWVLYAKRGSKWTTEILPAATTAHDLSIRLETTTTTATNQGLETKETKTTGEPLSLVALTAVDRVGNESEPVYLEIGAK